MCYHYVFTFASALALALTSHDFTAFIISEFVADLVFSFICTASKNKLLHLLQLRKKAISVTKAKKFPKLLNMYFKNTKSKSIISK